jgi:hypothetical protein
MNMNVQKEEKHTTSFSWITPAKIQKLDVININVHLSRQ